MRERIQGVPTVVYPESDGKPMAETDLHRDLMMDMILTLKHHFRDSPEVYVSGNLLVYYEEGNIQKSVAPDVFVVRGISKKLRRTYLLWEEAPIDFVLEIASPSTYKHDLTHKKALYASTIGVQEYYIYVPYGAIVPRLQGYRLVNGVYDHLAFVEDRLRSSVLGLDIGEHDGGLRLYDVSPGVWLQPPLEGLATAEARAETAETELVKALAELERLRGR